MWELYRKAETFGCRPSELLGVDDVYTAYCIDSATFTFGSALKGELEAVEGKNKKEVHAKQERLLRNWLGLPQKFRNPVMSGSGVEQQVTVKGED